MSLASQVFAEASHLVDMIVPQNGMAFDCCYGCGNQQADIFGTSTPHPCFVVGVCKSPECRERARLGMKYFLLEDDRDGAPLLLQEAVRGVRVPRSNGTVEEEWSVIGLWFPNDVISHVYVRKGSIEKKLRIGDFLEHNPDMEEALKQEKDRIIEWHMKIFEEEDDVEKTD